MPRTSTVHAVTAIGIDMGKNTLHMFGLDSRGAIVLREKFSRGRITARLANLPPCLVGIEAGLATHYVARELAFPPRSASRKEEMEKRSRQRVRDQVTHRAFGAETRMRSNARG